MRLLFLTACVLCLAGCEREASAAADVTACHREILGGPLHSPDAIIDVGDHRKMLGCMALRGFIFQAEDPKCAALTVRVDNPVCYLKEKQL